MVPEVRLLQSAETVYVVVYVLVDAVIVVYVDVYVDIVQVVLADFGAALRLFQLHLLDFTQILVDVVDDLLVLVEDRVLLVGETVLQELLLVQNTVTAVQLLLSVLLLSHGVLLRLEVQLLEELELKGVLLLEVSLGLGAARSQHLLLDLLAEEGFVLA